MQTLFMEHRCKTSDRSDYNNSDQGMKTTFTLSLKARGSVTLKARDSNDLLYAYRCVAINSRALWQGKENIA